MATVITEIVNYLNALNKTTERLNYWRSSAVKFIEANLKDFVAKNETFKDWQVGLSGESPSFQSVYLYQGKMPSGIIEDGKKLIKTGAGILFSVNPVGLVMIKITSPGIEDIWPETTLTIGANIEPTDFTNNQLGWDLINKSLAALFNATSNWYLTGKFEVTEAVGTYYTY